MILDLFTWTPDKQTLMDGSRLDAPRLLIDYHPAVRAIDHLGNPDAPAHDGGSPTGTNRWGLVLTA